MPSRLRTPTIFLALFALVTLAHLTLLRLPYYWDEGGYYIPAALDFYHRFTLIPHFTNAHPPLPSVLLGTLWHLTGGPTILTTRIAVCAAAAAGLTAVFRLTERLLDTPAALALTALTAVYPIWFAQSSLAHADIFAAAFTLWAFAHLPQMQEAGSRKQEAATTSATSKTLLPGCYSLLAVATLFSLAALSKETAIVEPATLAALTLFELIRDRRKPPQASHLRREPAQSHPSLTHEARVPNVSPLRRGFAQSQPSPTREHLYRLAALSFPVLPLAAWFAYHHHRTGFTFGNPEYLRYNATANFTAAHIAQALYYRAIHLFWQRNIWLPILLTIACLLLPRRKPSSSGNCHPERSEGPAFPTNQRSRVPHPYALFADGGDCHSRTLTPATIRTILILIASNWLAFSILGGALLTRYLLPIYPLILLLCLNIWRTRTRWWPALAALTAAAFLSALWFNPPTAFAPEDNLTYRDMIVVHQNAIRFLATHYPDAHVLTAWPVSTDLFNPWLGYTSSPIKVDALENFTLPEIQRAAAHPGDYDTALVFTTHYVSPALTHWYSNHPTTQGAQTYAHDRDLTPTEIAVTLGGTIVFEQHIGGEWAAVLRFPRSYVAQVMTERSPNITLRQQSS